MQFLLRRLLSPLVAVTNLSPAALSLLFFFLFLPGQLALPSAPPRRHAPSLLPPAECSKPPFLLSLSAAGRARRRALLARRSVAAAGSGKPKRTTTPSRGFHFSATIPYGLDRAAEDVELWMDRVVHA